MSRYIDADTLPRHGNRGGLVHWKDIEEAPTADVRENVKGEWQYHYLGIGGDAVERYEYRCSVCGSLPWADVERGEELHNFCPNCGADMRGGYSPKCC